MGTSPKQEQLTLLSDYDTGSTYHTAYQRLFANIRFGWETTGTKQHTVLLAAPTAFSAHATAAANLAIISAQNGIPTLLIDADLKTPALQKRFGTPQTRGLSDLFSESFNRSLALFSVLNETFVPHLRLLSAGNNLPQPNESTLFLANHLGDVLNRLQQTLSDSEGRPGLIIFHAPPVLTSLDTAQISTLVDQTFLIIAKGETTRTQARQAQEQLERAHATISGLVLLES